MAVVRHFALIFAHNFSDEKPHKVSKPNIFPVQQFQGQMCARGIGARAATRFSPRHPRWPKSVSAKSRRMVTPAASGRASRGCARDSWIISAEEGSSSRRIKPRADWQHVGCRPVSQTDSAQTGTDIVESFAATGSNFGRSCLLIAY